MANRASRATGASAETVTTITSAPTTWTWGASVPSAQPPRKSGESMSTPPTATAAQSVGGSVMPPVSMSFTMVPGGRAKSSSRRSSGPSSVSPTRNTLSQGRPARWRRRRNWPVATSSSSEKGIWSTIAAAPISASVE